MERNLKWMERPFVMCSVKEPTRLAVYKMAEERIKDLLKITKEVFKKLEIFMEYNLLISDINHQKDINFALDKL